MRVVIGEDSVLLREGAARLLSDEGIEVVGQAGDGVELVRKVRAHKPDVAIIDIRMPPNHQDEGLVAAAEIRQELPGTGILILSQYVEEHYVMRLLEDGTEGVGYLLKDRIAEVDRFVDAVRRVASGGSVLDPEVVAQMLGRRRTEGPLQSLTPRERDVLERWPRGWATRASPSVSSSPSVPSSGTSPRSSRSSTSPPPTAATGACSRCSPTWGSRAPGLPQRP